MKTLLTILFVMLFGGVQAQSYDTIPYILPVLDTTHFYDYRKANGTLAWGNVKWYDSTLIPVGGYAVRKGFVKNNFIALDGFVVMKTDCCNRSTAIQFLTTNKLPVAKPYIIVWPYNIPINGFGFIL